MQVEVATKRARGRPPVRSDDETRHLIADAARREFLARGFVGACVDDIAKSAGVSKKTLYRLIPTKADLFRASVTDRIARFMLAIDDESLGSHDVAIALERLLTEFGNLTLSSDTIAIQKLAIAEADRFPELAASFYADAILVTQAAVAKFLAKQCALGALELDDPYAAAGMLRGMMTMEPQRSVMFGRGALLTPAEIAERARTCVRLFLGGCLKDRGKAIPGGVRTSTLEANPELRSGV
jgi:AcrR family transcriptional regulator